MNSKPPISVSIIIPNYNGIPLFKKHLPDVISAAMGAEIIVVDDASTDNSVAFLREHFPSVKVVALATNQRFAAACNAGVAAATGDIIVLLNSDVAPTHGFLAPLVEPFTDPLVFAVGCKEIQQLQQKSVEAGRAGGTFSRGMFIHWKAANQNETNTLWVSGGSGAFRKSMWNELYGMDRTFSPAYEEDRDLCYRALKRGYKVVFAPKSIVYHNHETTNKKALGMLRMISSAHKNNLLFMWKNITDPQLFIQHILWLPYHLVITSIKTNGSFLLGFFWALRFLPRIMHLRQIELAEKKILDKDIVAYATQIH